MLSQQFLPRFGLQGGKTKNSILVLFDDKIDARIAKITNAIKKNHRLIYGFRNCQNKKAFTLGECFKIKLGYHCHLSTVNRHLLMPGYEILSERLRPVPVCQPILKPLEPVLRQG